MKTCDAAPDMSMLPELKTLDVANYVYVQRGLVDALTWPRRQASVSIGYGLAGLCGCVSGRFKDKSHVKFSIWMVG